MDIKTYHIRSGISSPCKLCLITDLHDRPYRHILRSIRREKPDYICIAGDLIIGKIPTRGTKMEQARHALPFLRACASLAPSYFSLGNHECFLSRTDLALIRTTGVKVLDNNYIALKKDLFLGGLTSSRVTDYRRERKAHYRRHPEDTNPYPFCWPRDPSGVPCTDWLDAFEAEKGFKVLLSHHPEDWESIISRRRIDLTCSGHAHGGQIRYYNIRTRQWDGLFAPSQGAFPALTSGKIKGRRGQLIISRGLANTAWPIPRLFNPKELIYIRLY